MQMAMKILFTSRNKADSQWSELIAVQANIFKKLLGLNHSSV
jgi:hypothetical protein